MSVTLNPASFLTVAACIFVPAILSLFFRRDRVEDLYGAVCFGLLGAFIIFLGLGDVFPELLAGALGDLAIALLLLKARVGRIRLNGK